MNQNQEIRYINNEPDFEVRESQNGPPKLVGYVMVFDSESNPIGDFVERLDSDAEIKYDKDVLALMDHDRTKLLGRRSAGTMTIRKDAKGVRVSIIPPDTQLGRDVVELVRRGDLKHMSVGMRVIKDQFIRDFSRNLYVRHLKGIQIREASIVTVPAYDETQIAVRSEWVESAKQDLERRLEIDKRFEKYADRYA